MERSNSENKPYEQMGLFNKDEYRRHFMMPNVIPLPIPLVENTGHDDFADVTLDDLEADILRAKIFDFPRRLPSPPEAA
jgi:hypothetical protein